MSSNVFIVLRSLSPNNICNTWSLITVKPSIDDRGNIIDKPVGYDELPAGLEEIKEQEISEEKPKMELQDLEDLRDKETGYVPLEKAINKQIKTVLKSSFTQENTTGAFHLYLNLSCVTPTN